MSANNSSISILPNNVSNNITNIYGNPIHIFSDEIFNQSYLRSTLICSSGSIAFLSLLLSTLATIECSLAQTRNGSFSKWTASKTGSTVLTCISLLESVLPLQKSLKGSWYLSHLSLGILIWEAKDLQISTTIWESSPNLALSSLKLSVSTKDLMQSYSKFIPDSLPLSISQSSALWWILSIRSHLALKGHGCRLDGGWIGDLKLLRLRLE